MSVMAYIIMTSRVQLDGMDIDANRDKWPKSEGVGIGNFTTTIFDRDADGKHKTHYRH